MSVGIMHGLYENNFGVIWIGSSWCLFEFVENICGVDYKGVGEDESSSG